MPKILLFCPAYERDGVDMLWPDTLASFEAVTAPAGVEVVREIGRDNPYPDRRNILHQFQHAQRRALEEGFDALCTHEADMLVPKNGLAQLWEIQADVVYGLYMLRHGAYVINAFRRMPESVNIGESLSFFPKEFARAVKAKVYPVSGCGMGFTLIRRNVLERFPLRAWGDNTPPDWALACDCQAANVQQICRFDVVCGHIEDNGRVLWPGKGERMDDLIKVKVLASFTGVSAGTTKTFTAGEVSTITPAEGMEAARAGFLEILEEAGDKPVARPRRAVSIETATGKGGRR